MRITTQHPYGRYVGGALFMLGWVLFVLGLSTFLCGSSLWGSNCFKLGLSVASGLALFGIMLVGGGMFLVGRSSNRTADRNPIRENTASS